MSFLKRLSKLGIGLFYLLILLEGLYMTSVFAIYLFSISTPIQSVLEKSPATSWLTDFYLSHFIDWNTGLDAASLKTDQVYGHHFSPFRLNVYDNRNYFWFIGFLLFFAGAVPVYYSKITRRHAVSGGVYRFVRHPQYLGFAIVGIPFLVIWPRFIVLVAYVSMLCFYYLLARREEKLCLKEFGEPYRDYLEKTPSMFLPGDWIIFRILQNLFSKIAPNAPLRVSLLTLLYILILGATITAAYALKHHTVLLLPHILHGDTLAIALKNSDRMRIADLLTLAKKDVRVTQKIAQARAEGLNTFLVYLLPADPSGVHFFKDHFSNTRSKEEWTGRRTPAYDVEPGIESIPRDELRMLLFWGTSTPVAQTAQGLLDRYMRPQPLLILGIDLRSRKTVGVVELRELEESLDPYRGSRMPLF